MITHRVHCWVILTILPIFALTEMHRRGHRGEVVRLRMMMHRPVGFNVASSVVAGKGGEGRMGRLGRVDRVGEIQDWQVQRDKVTARSPALATVALL